MCKAPETAPAYPEVVPARATTPEEVAKTEAWMERAIRLRSNCWRVEVKAQPDGGWQITAESPGVVLTLPDFLNPAQAAALAVKNIETLWRCQRQNLLAQ